MKHIRLLLAAFLLTGCPNEPPPTPTVKSSQYAEAEKLYIQGTRLLESDPELAIEYLTQSLELVSDAPPALYNRAVAYAGLGRDSEALADIASLERIDRNIGRELRESMQLSSVPYADLGNHELRNGRYEEAIIRYDSALAYTPEYGDAWVGKGLALQQLGRIDEALACYETAIKHEPENEYAYLNRADLYAGQGKLEEAESDRRLVEFIKSRKKQHQMPLELLAPK